MNLAPEKVLPVLNATLDSLDRDDAHRVHDPVDDQQVKLFDSFLRVVLPDHIREPRERGFVALPPFTLR